MHSNLINTLILFPPAQSNPSLVYPSFDKLVFQPINSLKMLMKDYNIKYRTFVCLAMSRGMLTGFLEALPKQTSEWACVKPMRGHVWGGGAYAVYMCVRTSV